jgi:flagellar motor switch protein FliG
LSDLVAFEDLGLLDGADLRAVLAQVSREVLLAALGGASAGFRRRLLTKLPSEFARELAEQLEAQGQVPFESARTSQEALVAAIYRLSRSAQIAFDLPDDMVA